MLLKAIIKKRLNLKWLNAKSAIKNYGIIKLKDLLINIALEAI